MAFRFFTVLLILSFTSLASQSKRFVIAPRGLNIRKAPTRNSIKIGKLDFCDTAFVENNSIYNTDTLYTSKDFGYYELLVDNDLLYSHGDRPVVANWVKVYFNQDSGYVVDTYLSKFQTKLKFEEIIYIDKLSTMWSLYFDPSDYNWYNIYRQGNVIQTREEKVDFISGINEYSGEVLEVIYDNKMQSIGLIGSKVEIECSKVYSQYYDEISNTNRNIENLYMFEKRYGPDKTYGRFLKDSIWTYQLISDNRFIPSGNEFKFNSGLNNPIKIKLIADIDNDGLKDYIIYCHTVYDLRGFALFLSRDSENGIYNLSGYSFLDFD